MDAGWRKGWRSCGRWSRWSFDGSAAAVLLAIVARWLLRQGRRAAFHLATGGETAPGNPGV